MKDRRFLIEENKEADDKKIQQITRSVGDNRKGHKRDPPNTINDIPNSKRVLPVKPLPSNQYMENLSQCLDLTERQKILAFDEKVLNVGRDSQFGAFSLRTSDRYRGINFHSQQKIPSGLTVNQTSMQKYSQLQKSKMQKSWLPSQTSHVVKNSLRQYLGQSEEGYSMESNIPGRINYDSILNHNLIANQNMILDDSILEVFLDYGIKIMLLLGSGSYK